MDILRRVLNRGVFGQSLLALAFNVGGVLSGRLAVIFTPIFMAYPWILAIFPLVLTVRGDISGVLSGKVGTMLHTGEIRPQLRGNTRTFHSLLSSIFVLTFVDTIGVGLLSFVFNLVLQQTSSENLIYFIVIPTLTCVLSMVIAIPITLFVASKAFKSGLDPDILVYPIMSTTNDILISVIYVSIVSLILRGGVYVVFMEALIVIIALASTVLFIRHIREGLFKKTLKEGLLLVLLSSVFGTINGLTLTSVRRDVEKHPSILMVYPALMNTLGNIGSIIGSTETTKLALGYIKSFGQRDLLSVEAAAFLIHVLFGVAALAVGHVTDVAVDPVFIIKLSLFSNALSFLVISVFALTIASRRRPSSADSTPTTSSSR
jgi:mgtE-like transporter